MRFRITIAGILIVLVVALCLLLSNTHDPFEPRDIDCEYPGAVVMSRDSFWHCLSLKYKGEIIHTGYFDIQAHYRVGDVINGNCITN